MQAIRETKKDGCPTPRAERKEQWQVCPDLQKDNARPWKPGEYKLAAEGPWQITGQVVERAAKGNKKTTGVGTDAFHPRVLLGLSSETCQPVVDFPHVVEVIGRWPAAASSIMFFLSPKTLHNDRLISLLARQIQWWEWVRADFMEY